MNRNLLRWCGVAVFFACGAVSLQAEPVRNGNEMALAYMQATPQARAAQRKEITGIIHTFRFLRIVERQAEGDPPRTISFRTIEPSSDMEVAFSARQRVSLKIAANLHSNDCVAVKGRVKSIGEERPNRIVLEPAIILHADRDAPKAGAENLSEVDPTAH